MQIFAKTPTWKEIASLSKSRAATPSTIPKKTQNLELQPYIGCIVIRKLIRSLMQDYVPTVFDNFSTKVVVDGSTINLGWWDKIRRIAANLRPLSYRGADVFLLAFFLISKASYENVAKKDIKVLVDD
ncbi:hypothetical protein AAC387_Pa07g1673 [Persea americana]